MEHDGLLFDVTGGGTAGLDWEWIPNRGETTTEWVGVNGMDPNVFRPRAMRWVSLVAILLSAVAGCERKDAQQRVEEKLAAHVDLELTDRTHHTPLRDELSRLRAASQLPAQLQQRQPDEGSEFDLTSISASLFDSPAQVERVHKSLDELWPTDGLEFPPSALEHALRITEKYEGQRQKLAGSVRQTQSQFRIAFDQGTAADVSWLDAVRLVARLEALGVARFVQAETPDQALDPLSDLARIAGKLEQSPSLVAHLMAVDIRREWIAGIRLVATHPAATARTHQLLFELVAADRRKGSHESLAWIGDRAAGMHAYEMVRAGEYLSLLSEEEYQALEERNETMDQALVVRRNVDEDETYYLETMRLLISKSEQPFHARRQWLNDWFTELDARSNQPKFPAVAADLLLVGITTAQQRLARGQARGDAWYLALAAINGHDLPEDPVLNAETGEPFAVAREDQRVEVWGLIDDDADLFPSLTRRPE
ncbi:MAG: hypothetical protein R3B96_12310 [Pirellulaceae bacterium]